MRDEACFHDVLMMRRSGCAGSGVGQYEDRRARRALVDIAHVEQTVFEDNWDRGWAILSDNNQLADDNPRKLKYLTVFMVDGRKLTVR